MKFNTHSRIAIVGAGIGGLALACALKQHNFQNIILFEKDQTFDCRRQGYGLTILQGKSALRSLGVLEDAKKYNSPSKAHYIFDWKGNILGFYGTLFWDSLNQKRSTKWSDKGLSMHIPRQSLRKVLLDRLMLLDKSTILWGMNLLAIQHNEEILRLIFEGSENKFLEFDVVIGCDGIYSTLRDKTVLKEKSSLNYLGIMVVLGLCGSGNELAKQRVFQTIDGSWRLFAMPFLKDNPQMNVMWQLSFPISEFQAAQLASQPRLLKSYLLERCRKWHQPIPEMLQNTLLTNLMGIRAYDRDPQLPHAISDKVILLGDAAHPMSPFKGQGANQALIDAIQLSDLMVNSSSIKSVKKIFQDKMMLRVSKKVLQSRERAGKYHNPDFLRVQNFLYPRIDSNLISEINLQGVTASSGSEIESMILEVMKKLKYVV